MNVAVTVDDETLGRVKEDLTSSRDAQIISFEDDAFPSGDALPKPDEERRFINVSKVYAPPDPFEVMFSSDTEGNQLLPNRPRRIVARVPLRTMVGYLRHLRSHTQGRGSFVMKLDRFEKMPVQRQKFVLKELRGI